MTLLDYIKECDAYGHEYFYSSNEPPYNDDSFGIVNNHVIASVQDRAAITKELNELLKKMNKSSDKIKKTASHKSDTLAIDFDGVIHSYKQGWTGDEPLDEPMEGVEDALKQLKSEGWTLVIMSTRNANRIRTWLEKYSLDQYFSYITNTKIPAKLYLDDRGYHFENWKDALVFVENFKDRYDK